MNTNDIWKDKRLVSPKLYRWEQWYPLQNDPRLFTAGIEIGARVTVQPEKPPKLRIVFRGGDEEASVDCVHVAVYSGSLESLPPDADLGRSSESHPVILAPEEHFFALNSYVAGIAEVGLGVMFTLAREAGNMPVGFNALMQQQILKALTRVAPAATLDLCLWILDDAILSGGDSAQVLLATLRGALTDLLKGDSNIPPQILARLAWDENEDVRRAVGGHKNTPPETHTYLAEVANREAMARNNNTSPEILARLAGNELKSVREDVARNKKTPPEVLARLAGDQNWRVRSGVAVNKSTPPEVLARLAEDEVLDVRRVVAVNKNTPPEVLARLASDTDWFVREKIERKRKKASPYWRNPFREALGDQ
ncbi:MAG: hypothetical protein RBG13Loki_1771 [Promethearchaeota archaeon CR_4]|nr:MAG: hypothetical protein RBG13Loki_1771 [Candidatus Lokiarchaeota archaeon CR_4]